MQDKTATIALIKANAFPTKNRMKLMQRYAKSLFTYSEYRPVTTLPTKSKLLLEWDIDTTQYMIGRKVDKERVIELYNAKKKAKFDEEQERKFNRHMAEFKCKYATSLPISLHSVGESVCPPL